ncbi:hypothetical protein [Labrys neptuniae]
MLKVTFLTCAILAWQPLIGVAQAGEAMPGTPSAASLVWTGRFIAVTKVPVLANVAPLPTPPAPLPARNDEVDIVGSIPVKPVSAPRKPTVQPRGAGPTSLCTLPGLTAGHADDLACGGVQHNRWSARAQSFNYDLGSVRADFANAPMPYAVPWN